MHGVDNMPINTRQLIHLGRLVQHAALVVRGDAEHTHVQRMRQLHVVQVSRAPSLILVGA